MEEGYLGIPRFKIDPLPNIDHFLTSHFPVYSDILNKTDYGQKIKKEFKEDSRIMELEGKEISHGFGSQLFNIETLAMWFIWYANEQGEEVAQIQLEKFLNESTITVINTLWVLGLEVSEPIYLTSGITILPIDQMINSQDKYKFLVDKFSIPPTFTLIPNCAITIPCIVNKIRNDDIKISLEEDAELFDSQKKICEIAWLLNALDEIICLPYYSTSYPHSDTPFGPFNSSGGGYGIYDVSRPRTTKLSLENKNQINELISVYNSLSKNEKSRFQRIFERFSQSKRSEQIENKVLDLGILLEMLLLKGGSHKEQLSFSFRLRGSWLIGQSPEEREEIYYKLRDIYNFRSQIAHSGILCKGKEKDIQIVRENFPDYEILAGKILRHLLKNNDLNWDKLILDSSVT